MLSKFIFEDDDAITDLDRANGHLTPSILCIPSYPLRSVCSVFELVLIAIRITSTFSESHSLAFCSTTSPHLSRTSPVSLSSFDGPTEGLSPQNESEGILSASPLS